jgi:hypothetical protein
MNGRSWTCGRHAHQHRARDWLESRRTPEYVNMHVKQVDLLSRTIRLEPGTTKNRDGREVTMTRRVLELLKLCVFGKTAEDFVMPWLSVKWRSDVLR